MAEENEEWEEMNNKIKRKLSKENEALRRENNNLTRENMQLKKDNIAYRGQYNLIDDRFYEINSPELEESVIHKISEELIDALIKCDKLDNDEYLSRYMQMYMDKPDGDYYVFNWDKAKKPERLHRGAYKFLLSQLPEQLHFKQERESSLSHLGKGESPNESDIIGILTYLDVDIAKGERGAWNDFWIDIIYANIDNKLGLKQSDMVQKSKDNSHSWGKEPIRLAVKTLKENGLLKKKGSRYIIDKTNLKIICK